MRCPAAPHTHSIEQVCALIGCDSRDWFIDRVRNGTFPSHRVVREHRFTDDDIARILDACAITEPRKADGPATLLPTPTARSRRRGAA